jgi:hypothetical protein
MAATRTTPGSNYVTLSTIETPPTGLPYPNSRTVVFRGFSPLSENPPALSITTDIRSAKISNMSTNNNGEIVWWFPATQEQYRFRGTLDVIGSGETDEARVVERERMWEKTRLDAKITFTRGPPGMPFVDDPDDAPTCDEKSVESVVDNFAVLLLKAHRVDYLKLGDVAVRKVYEWNKDTQEWSSSRVNP